MSQIYNQIFVLISMSPLVLFCSLTASVSVIMI